MPTQKVLAPTAGMVTLIQKKVGDEVEVDEPVVVIECMKVHIPIVSPVAGRVASIAVRADETIAEDQVVFTISV